MAVELAASEFHYLCRLEIECFVKAVDSSSCGSNGTCLTYDAFGRMVEKSVNSNYTEVLHSPVGKMAIMSGQTASSSYMPLPGGATEYESGATAGSHTFWHKDWLGSARFGSLVAGRSNVFDRAFAPFGETYDNFGATNELSFTGDTQDIISGLYDTPNRELHPTQGRWISPDPAGLAAASFGSPQSWNRYAYVQNIPTIAIDPSGLACFGIQKSLGLCNTAAGFGGNPSFDLNEFDLLGLDLYGMLTWNGERWGRYLIGDAFDVFGDPQPQQGGCTINLARVNLHFASCPFPGGKPSVNTNY